MPQPGFYNDNEYRAYPFIYVANVDPQLPTSAIVDAGIILDLNAGIADVDAYSIWLTRVTRTNTGFNFVFVYAEKSSTVTGPELIFYRPDTADQWATIYSRALECWEGFLVTGPLDALRALLAVNQTIYFARDAYQIEPGRVQNLYNGYLRSITVANYDRTRVPACDSDAVAGAREIIVNKANIDGVIKLKEGYNCQITQTDRATELSVTALKNAGAPVDAELCAHGSELPLYDNEPLAADSLFYSGGPACSEVISSINGVAGSGINFVGGNGVAITTDGTKITITRKDNAQTNCVTPQG